MTPFLVPQPIVIIAIQRDIDVATSESVSEEDVEQDPKSLIALNSALTEPDFLDDPADVLGDRTATSTFTPNTADPAVIATARWVHEHGATGNIPSFDSTGAIVPDTATMQMPPTAHRNVGGHTNAPTGAPSAFPGTAVGPSPPLIPPPARPLRRQPNARQLAAMMRPLMPPMFRPLQRQPNSKNLPPLCSEMRRNMFSFTSDDMNFQNPDSMPTPSPMAQRIVWERTRASVVYLVGSFNNWRDPYFMHPEESGARHVIYLDLPKGSYTYKFIVDGKWWYDVLKPTKKDNDGNWNNVLEL